MDVSTLSQTVFQAASTTPMMICPTTHNDWDWQKTFGDYYNDALNDYGVHGILDSVTKILSESGDTAEDFRFSYAEVGFLRQYLGDNPDKVGVLQNNAERFSLLGGGITSPDNQVAHSEVFIRNYLTGREYLETVGLQDNVFPVAWLPDDFGHSPQLPVLVEALGMKAIGLSRIPGSPQPNPCSDTQKAAAEVCGNGTSFYWPGNDNSSVFTHYMPRTYFGITNDGPLSSPQQGMQGFLSNGAADCVWPGRVIFATQGGDWQFPNSSALGGSAAGSYNWTGVNGTTVSVGNITATGQLSTFAEYYNSLTNSGSQDPTLRQFELFAENYWTGYFASRPQLKIDHYQAAQLLIGAEVLGSILAVYGGTTSQMRASLAEAIADGWNLLVPTTHHDFITGTSCDDVYYSGTSCVTGTCVATGNQQVEDVWDSRGQLYMSNQTVILANNAMSIAMGQLATVAGVNSTQNGVPVLVFNQLGRDLNDTAMVEMVDPSNGTVDYQVQVANGFLAPVQRSSDGALLFQVPGMRSMAYQVVYLVPVGPATPPMAPQPVKEATYLFGNDVVNLTLSLDSGWAISNLSLGRNSYVQKGSTSANRIGLWNDQGNIYQFGMEYCDLADCTTCDTYGFSFDSFLDASGPGTLVEAGPVRWRFNASLSDKFGNSYTTQYELIRDEALVRITTTGAAPGEDWGQQGWSVMASFPMQTANGSIGTVLEYGTAYFWEDRDPQRSWDGVNFRASHDFAQLVSSDAGSAVAAVYHNGIPAWTIDGSTLRGVLLRNTPGDGRGASGSDTDRHTQRYTLDVEAQLAKTGYPLRTALYAQTPLRAIPVDLRQPATMPDAAQLASVFQPDALLTVGKTNVSLVLRIQQSRTTGQLLEVNLPFLATGGKLSSPPRIVTALETPADSAPPVTTSKTVASFFANRALWTMEVPVVIGDEDVQSRD